MDNLGCCVSDVLSMLFWWDPWLDKGVFKDKFSRFLHLAENKMVSVLRRVIKDRERMKKYGLGPSVY